MPSYSNQELLDILDAQARKFSPSGTRFKFIKEASDLFFLLREKVPDSISVPSGESRNLPLVLVFPFGLMPFEDQLQTVRYKGKSSHSFLNPEDIVNVVDAPDRPTAAPYLLVNVECGYKSLGLSPYKAGVELTPRHAMNVEEVLALTIINPEIFSDHNLHASGSRILDTNHKLFVPDFYVYGGKIKMKRDSELDADPGWATPSWESIITL